MSEKQESEEMIDYLLPYLHDLVLDENKGERVAQPFHIRFGREEES